MREFETGATRNDSDDKLGYAGFLSSDVLESFAQYMHEHRQQADGAMRDPDNWKKGIGMNVYMDSLWRHFMDVYKMLEHDVNEANGVSLEEAINACLFNLMGMQYENLTDERSHVDAIQERAASRWQ